MADFNTLAEAIEYFAGDKKDGTLGVDLSPEDARILFAVIRTADNCVNLNLSACTGPTEWGRYDDAGRVVSLALPDKVTKIADGMLTAPTFGSFVSLETFRANGVKTVGAYAFVGRIGRTAFTDVDFPQAVCIGKCAFNNCTALAEINLPKTTSVKDDAFNSCTALVKVKLPQVTLIGEQALAFAISSNRSCWERRCRSSTAKACFVMLDGTPERGSSSSCRTKRQRRVLKPR